MSLSNILASFQLLCGYRHPDKDFWEETGLHANWNKWFKSKAFFFFSKFHWNTHWCTKKHTLLAHHTHSSTFRNIKPHLVDRWDGQSLTIERPLTTSLLSPADCVCRPLFSSPRSSWRLFRLAERQPCPSQPCTPRHNFHGPHVELPNVMWIPDHSTLL